MRVRRWIRGDADRIACGSARSGDFVVGCSVRSGVLLRGYDRVGGVGKGRQVLEPSDDVWSSWHDFQCCKGVVQGVFHLILAIPPDSFDG